MSASTVAVPVYDVILNGQPGILVFISGLSSVSIGVVSTSNGPSLTISRMMSSAVDQGLASGETPEAYTVGTADWSMPLWRSRVELVCRVVYLWCTVCYCPWRALPYSAAPTVCIRLAGSLHI